MKASNEKVRVVIVDDEPIAREGVRVQVNKDPKAEIVRECRNGLEAVDAIKELSPDIVFLDVQMPGMDGFEVLQNLVEETLPAIVFVTAYDKYALKAFEISAVDYLLKPFDAPRFETAFNRAKAQVRQLDNDSINRKLKSLLEALPPSPKYLQKLVLKTGGRIFFLQVDEILWMEAADNYVSVHVGRESHLIRETLTGLETKLNPEQFVRIRHSAIINTARIKELRPLFKSTYEIVLNDGTKLTTSRRYYKKVAALLAQERDS